MSFLAPLYALGLLAVAAPLIFHLIRRAPKGRVPFSSLMFLSPSPPRFTRRSRLDQWLLFLLRAAALCLLALAFMRPFLRLEGSPDPGAGDGQRVAVLIDTSASMRRGDLWQRAVAEAEAVLANAHPTDEVALFAFDLSARPLLGFREAAALEPSQRRAVAADRLRALEPGWGGTDLGRALLDAVAAVNDAGASDGQAGARARRIVLVSDLQQGARLEALASAEWPADVELEVKTLTAEGDNAGLGLLAERPEDERAGGAADLRVRLFNDAGSQQPQFTLSWADAGEGAAQAVEAYVPPGESRVVRVPRPPEGASWRLLRLKGDAHPFDNTLFVAAPLREEVTVVYLGDDPPDDPEGLRYYLDRGLGAMPGRSVTVLSPRPGEGLTWEALRPVPLAVVSGETTPANAGLLRRYLDEGGTVLYVATAPGRAE
ncbi:MAG TPA: BatA domain-containing protein, partial [Gemmataceae bacterium]